MPCQSKGLRSSRHSIRPALHGGVTRRSRFSNFLSCDRGLQREGHGDCLLKAFVFPSDRQETKEDDGVLQTWQKNIVEGASPQMLAALASTAAALGGPDAAMVSGMPPEVAVACIPFLAPAWGAEGASQDGSRQSDLDGLTDRARQLHKLLAGTCIGQAVMATLQFAYGDAISGLIGCAIGTLGMHASSPVGYRMLPTYIVLAFCNGTMQFLVGSELAASHHILANATIAGMKFTSIIAIASPAVMFAGMAVAWHLHCELRSIALQALPPSMRGNLIGAPPVDGMASAAPGGPIGQGSMPVDMSGPFRAFQGQSHRLHEVKA